MVFDAWLFMGCTYLPDGFHSLFFVCVCVVWVVAGGVGVDGYIHASVNMWRYVMWVGNVWVGTCMPPCIYEGV